MINILPINFSKFQFLIQNKTTGTDPVVAFASRGTDPVAAFTHLTTFAPQMYGRCYVRIPRLQPDGIYGAPKVADLVTL